MRNGNGTTSVNEAALARVEDEAAKLLAERTDGIEDRDASTGSHAATILKSMDSMFEHAVHTQVEPLRALITEAEAMIGVQFEHLARIKQEAQVLMLNGERANAIVTAVRGELAEMRSRHAALVNAKTS